MSAGPDAEHKRTLALALSAKYVVNPKKKMKTREGDIEIKRQRAQEY